MSNNSTKPPRILIQACVRTLKKHAVGTTQTMSEYVDRAVANATAEDLEDIADIEERLNQPTETLEEFTKNLRKDGILQS